MDDDNHVDVISDSYKRGMKNSQQRYFLYLNRSCLNKTLFSISKFTRAMDRAYKKNPRATNVQKFVKFQKFFRMKCEDIFIG